jgi:ribosomal 30S subunit maturation factor RimM
MKLQLPTLVAAGLSTALTLGAPAVVLAADHNNNTADNAAYSHIGQGGVTGTAMPIANKDDANNTTNSDITRPSQRNPLLADNGDVRLDKMSGTTVYNDQDQKLGSIDGVVAGRNGVWAIVSTDDQNRTVAVPLKDFRLRQLSGQRR